MPYKGFTKWADIRALGKDTIYNQMLEALLLQQGKKNPWELPSFAPTVQGIRSQADRGLESLSSVLTRSGVTGPSAGLALEKQGETSNDAIMNLVNAMQGRTEQEVGKAIDMAKWRYGKDLDWANAKAARKTSGGGLSQFLPMITGGLSGGLDILGSQLTPAAKSAIEPMTLAGGGLGSLGGGTLGAGAAGADLAAGAATSASMCCFIFLEGNNGVLEESVRNFRDKYFAPDSWVSKGYKKMAKWLIPMMRKSRTIKRAVKLLMLDPLARVARWHEGSDRLGWLFIPVGVFWCFIWGESARIEACFR